MSVLCICYVMHYLKKIKIKIIKKRFPAHSRTYQGDFLFIVISGTVKVSKWERIVLILSACTPVRKKRERFVS